MSPELELFVLYYTCWREGDFKLAEMRTQVLDEIGENGLKSALAEFKNQRLEREKNGDFRTYYEVSKQ